MENKRVAFIVKSTVSDGAAFQMLRLLVPMLPPSISLVVIPYEKEKSSSEDIPEFIVSFGFHACIVWGNVDAFAPLLAFLREQHLPTLVIGSKYHNFPSFIFDSYSGMETLVQHCIYVHGSRKLACIQGPDDDYYAKERFEAFRDALRESSVPILPSLIAPPVSWKGGRSAMETLFNRGLVPGKDYDSIVCVGDLLIPGVFASLQEHGYRIPADVLVVGYNDSAESRMSQPPATTVRLPYHALCVAVINALPSLLEGSPVADQTFKTQLILRPSCGCGAESVIRKFSSDRLAILSHLKEFYALTDDAMERLEGIVSGLTHKDPLSTLESLFIPLCKDIVRSGEDIELFHASLLSLFPEDRETRREIAEGLFPLISRVQEQEMVSRLDEERRKERLHGRFEMALKECRTQSALQREIERSLPSLGYSGLTLLSAGGVPLFSYGAEGSVTLVSIDTNGFLLLSSPLWLEGGSQTALLLSLAFHLAENGTRRIAGKEASIVRIGLLPSTLRSLYPDAVPVTTYGDLLSLQPQLVISSTLSPNEVEGLLRSMNVRFIMHRDSWKSSELEGFLHLPHVLLTDSVLESFPSHLKSLRVWHEPNRYARQILLSIRNHQDERGFSLDTIGQEVCLSPDYASALFASEFGVPLRSYVARARLFYASSLLSTTMLPVDSIARMSGFTRSSYFCVAYKRCFGFSPLSFRSNSGKVK